MDQGPSTSSQQAAGKKKLEDLELAQLENLLQKNREIQVEVKSTLKMLMSELNNAVTLKETLEANIKAKAEIKGCSSSDYMLAESNLKISYPYFQDKSNFPAPQNRDDFKMNKSKYITLSSLKPAFKWTQREMKALDAAVKRCALRKLQVGLIEKRNNLNAKLGDKLNYQKMLEEIDDDADMEEVLKAKLLQGRSIPELKLAIKEVELEIEAQAGEPLKQVLRDGNIEHDWALISDVEFAGYRTENECRAMWKSCLHKGLARKVWTEEETNQIIQLAHNHEYKNWLKIAEEFGEHRSAYQVFIHYQIESNKLRNNWTDTEDNNIRIAVNKMRMGNYIPFSAIADLVPGRTAKQIRQRWRCHLDPGIFRGPFNSREDVLLIICRHLKRMTYREISEQYIPRSEPQLKTRYACLKASTALEKLDSNVEIKLDNNVPVKSLRAQQIQALLNRRTAGAIKRICDTSVLCGASEKKKMRQSTDAVNAYSHVKFLLKKEVSDEGTSVLKVEMKGTGGRKVKKYDQYDKLIEQFFFTYYSQKKGRLKSLSVDNVDYVTKRVRDLCQFLNARLTLDENDPIEEEDPQQSLFMSHFRNLQIEDEPITSLFPPSFSNLVGYRSLILDLERLKLQKMEYPSRAGVFVDQCSQASLFMDEVGSEKEARSHATGCQNVHLIPANRVNPTLTIHLHEDGCSGSPTISRTSEAEQDNTSEALTVCGNIQQFYIIKKSDQLPSLRLCIEKKMTTSETFVGQKLHLENTDREVPLVDLDEDENHISPSEALRLWKERFTALFMSPVVLDMYKAPESHSFTKEPAPELQTVEQKKPYKKMRPKGNRHWKRVQMKSKESTVETQPKVIKKRKTQAEMIEIYKQRAQDEAPQRTSRRSAASSLT